MAARIATMVVALATLACGAQGDDPVEAEGAARVAAEAPREGVVVATVDGVPIHRDEVLDVMRRTGLSAREALTRLEEEVVLHRAALSAGVDEHAPEVDDVARRAAVQALIADRIEGTIRPDTIDADVVAARMARDAAFFSQPERRASVHLLVEPSREEPELAEPAAERFAQQVLEAARAAADPRAVVEAAATESFEGRRFTARFEAVPAARSTGDLVAPFADALFAAERPGLIGEVVHTSFGFHVIVLTEIVPPWSIPPDEAETLVRRQLAVEARAEALIALEEELIAALPPQLDDRALEAAMRAPVPSP